MTNEEPSMSSAEASFPGRAEGIQQILTLPPRMADEFAALEHRPRPEWFATHDPTGCHLGSGGGTVNALATAWKELGSGSDFATWLSGSGKLVIHGGGQSRRLPAYAPMGKLLMPIPVLRWARGQSLNQTLLDLQLPEYRRVLGHAGSHTSVMICSGDVWLRLPDALPPFPEVDVLGLGMWVTPETARHFGVFFCPRQRPSELAFFLQKPAPERIRELAADYLFLIDTGMWLLSERAVRVLFERCGWQGNGFKNGVPDPYELYSQFGLSLGQAPEVEDPAIRALTSAVVPLPKAEFYHFGTSRQMIESISALQNLELDATILGLTGAKRRPDQYLLNSRFEDSARLDASRTLWIENSVIPRTWRLARDHVLTGVPENEWDLELEPGVCLDFVPVNQSDVCARVYGIDDSFNGRAGDERTTWLHRPLGGWFTDRGIEMRAAGIGLEMDIQQAPLFPVLDTGRLTPRFLRWLYAAKPERNEEYARAWVALPRLSAQQIGERAHLGRLYAQRDQNRRSCLEPLLRNYRWSVFFKLDLESTAREFARGQCQLPPPPPADRSGNGPEPMQVVRDHMFRSAVARHRRVAGWEGEEERAFAHLRETLVREAQLAAVWPRRTAVDDQIIWGRSPVRLDLAGGWSDTPPYCLEHGGKVVNVGVDLNGQPPIQVFAKLSERHELTIRSIDLGLEQRVRAYEDLESYARPGDGFALAKAAFALCGFLPRFHARGGFHTLEEQLRDFGGGIEISLLSAVPKGSGLGTSSILAATLLATLGDLCGLGWDRHDLFVRTLALEQMLTTGGGWQDQAGGLYRGFKLIETGPGLAQKPTLRWLPEHLLSSEYANQVILLYYTGITRLAKNILQEIVRGIFLNSPRHLRIVDEIAQNAETTFNAAQKGDHPALVASIRQSWRLNQQLDAGTNPPAVQAVLAPVWDYVDAVKLLGAGGGGYLLMWAKDAEAAGRVRRTLRENPPNERARFVSFGVSATGLQLTRS